MHSSILRRYAPALAVTAFTLALRSLTAWRVAHSPYGVPSTGDMRFYAEWAARIAEGRFTDFHAFYGQPLYAYSLGALFATVGFQPLLVGLLQSCIDAVTALLIFHIGRRAFPDTPWRGQGIGTGAAVGWALFVPAAAYVGLFIPVAWTAFGWWFCVWWVVARSRAARPAEWLGTATLTGVLSMSSATMLFALPLLAVRAVKCGGMTKLLAIVAGTMIGTSPAWLHNCVVARDPVFLSAHSGLNFWIGNNPEANGYPRIPRDLPSDQAALLEESIKIPETAAGRPLPRSAVSAYWSAKAWEFIATDPLRWLQLLGTKVRNFWSGFVYDDLSSITALRDARLVFGGLSFAMIAALGLPGLLLAIRSGHSRPVAGALLLQLAALLPVFVNERYRLAAAPGLLLLAAFFLAELWRAAAMASWGGLVLALSLLALSTYAVTSSGADRALWSLNDYKTARRHILAGEYELGETRMRQALEMMLGRQALEPAIANGFAELANEQAQSGQSAMAVATIDAALRINPADQRLAQLRARWTTAAPGRE